ncbi:hypothetical protein NA57DRAFT_76336 [Rhizodiscina lignyota]|uniref:Uncharacterized protein n=1 Tax=Rhizodiscina lignyota TaxID=1504668 RepID=A0A9P4M983_9PEZI|nr:hypothetical protein NA57DRAFT_76336 [Rhizodiscina lignyota]
MKLLSILAAASVVAAAPVGNSDSKSVQGRDIVCAVVCDIEVANCMEGVTPRTRPICLAVVFNDETNPYCSSCAPTLKN